MITEKMWLEMRRLYEAGDAPQNIATRFGLTPKQVRQKAYRSGWGALKATRVDAIDAEIKQKVDAKVTLAIASEVGDSLSRWKRIFEKTTDNIEKYVENSDGTISKAPLDEIHKESCKQGLKHYLQLDKLANIRESINQKDKEPENPLQPDSTIDFASMTPDELKDFIKSETHKRK